MANLAYINITPSASPLPGLVTDLNVASAGTVVVQSTFDSASVTIEVVAGWNHLPIPVLFVLTGGTASGLVGALATSARDLHGED